jgi:hypothetical protein
MISIIINNDFQNSGSPAPAKNVVDEFSGFPCDDLRFEGRCGRIARSRGWRYSSDELHKKKSGYGVVPGMVPGPQ